MWVELDVDSSYGFFQLKLYQLVIEDVVTNVRDAFLDEGVDEQVLQEMKQIWTNRLMASKAVDVLPEPQAPQSQPAILANNPKVSDSYFCSNCYNNDETNAFALTIS